MVGLIERWGVKMASRKLNILSESLSKKEKILNEKLQNHFDTVAQANGQPLNDKRNGYKTLAKYETLEKLRTALADREKYEAEQAELERVRKDEAERLQREHDERIAREAVEKAKQEAEKKAKAEAERVEREKAEALKREELLKAQKEAAELREIELQRQAEEHQKQAEIDKQKAVEAERIRIEREGQQQLEAEQKAEAERVANIEYKRSVNQSIVLAMANYGLSKEQAQGLIKAIYKNEIPHISIKY